MIAVHEHHRKRRSQGGDNSYGNLIDLPMEIHEAVHAHPEVAYEHGLLVKSHDDPASIKPNVAGFCADVGIELTESKPKRKKLTGDELSKRKTVSIRLPEGVDGEYMDQLWQDAEKVELEQPDTKFDPANSVTTGKLLVAVLERFTGRAG